MSPRFEHEQPLHDIEYFVALDMDGTLLRSYELTPLIAKYFIDDEVQRERAIAVIDRQKGKDFDSFTYLAAESGQDLNELDSAKLVDTLVEVYGEGYLRELLLMPGAEQICETLRANDISHGILTKGGVTFQNFKLDLLRILIREPDLRAMITTSNAKSSDIEATWWDDALGRFVIPRELASQQLIAKNIVMVDDKRAHLESAHPQLHGYHVETLTVADLTADIAEKGIDSLTVGTDKD